MDCSIYRYKRRPDDEPGDVPGFFLRRKAQNYKSEWLVLQSVLLANTETTSWSTVKYGDFVHIPLVQYPLYDHTPASMKRQCDAILQTAADRRPQAYKREPDGVTLVVGYPEAIPGGWAFFVGLAFEFRK